MIRIKTKKLLVNGEKQRHILDIKMMTADKLPRKYLEGGCLCYLTKDKHIWGYPKVKGTNFFLLKGSTYSEKDFQEVMKIILKCGNHLEKINRQLAKEAQGWVEEKETIEI